MKNYVLKERKRIKEEYGYDYMDPLSDVAFKSIFSMDKKHSIIRILAKEFLGADLKTVMVRHPGFIAKGKNNKGEETDYYFEVDNKKVTIECNRKYSLDLIDRNKSHLRRMIIDDEDFSTVQINFDGYDILKENLPVYKFSIKEDKIESDLYKELIQIFHINLPYFAKLIEKGYNNDKKFSLFDKMCMIFQTRNRKVLEEIVKGEEELMNIKKAIEDLNNNEGAWRKYTKAELERIAEAKEKMEEGYEKGLRAGIEDGIKQGIEQGIKTGKHSSRLEIAKNMLHLGIDKDIVAQSTGLSQNEINKL